MIEIPKKGYSKGSNKALRAMKKRYGPKKGTGVFYAKANKYGKRGTTRMRKANSIYSKGSHRIKLGRKR